MLFAEISGIEIASLVTSIVVGAGGLIIAIVMLSKKQDVQVSPNPMSVELVESLVTKDEYNKHTERNEATHRDIFSKIGGVERGAASILDAKITGIWNEVGQQGKSIASLQKETELQNQTLAAVQSDIKLILGRLPRNSNEH
jgi:hypothetical protein